MPATTRRRASSAVKEASFDIRRKNALEYFLEFVVALETAQELQQVFPLAEKLAKAMKSPTRPKMVTDANHMCNCLQRLEILFHKFDLIFTDAIRRIEHLPT